MCTRYFRYASTAKANDFIAYVNSCVQEKIKKIKTERLRELNIHIKMTKRLKK